MQAIRVLNISKLQETSLAVIIKDRVTRCASLPGMVPIKEQKRQFYNIKIWKRLEVNLLLNELFTLLKRNRGHVWEKPPKTDERLTITRQRRLPLLSFRTTSVWTQKRCLAYWLTNSVPWGSLEDLLQAVLKATKRQGLRSHLRNSLHSSQFYIMFPKILWLKRVGSFPLFVHDPQRSQVTSLFDHRARGTAGTGIEVSGQGLFLQTLQTCSRIRLLIEGFWGTTWKGRETFIFMRWVRFILGKNRFSTKIEFIYFNIEKNSILRKRRSVWFFSPLFENIKFVGPQLLVDMMDWREAECLPPKTKHTERLSEMQILHEVQGLCVYMWTHVHVQAPVQHAEPSGPWTGALGPQKWEAAFVLSVNHSG